ncbi:MAG: sulfurtransferase TusA family protein [Candidatus Eisenbacteria bacterium]|uniref:Sulfurtransferase TusA family protein n=1 Tax=Eiseniibacteriota bacterium TaxID=2212470 RepID=A0A956NIQ5_UNCEI|nr:sulfurtransferase TusA family protein [Candidatus Eisenbacteria bacterium]MCB9464454.1 sulfurtransferase TusA family protein [Candidatus Eisenbacteria bacterium]
MTDRWSGLPSDWEVSSRFDGGDGGCGEMLLDMRIHFRPLCSGARVAVLAPGEGAPVEIPAWCRVTGHRLLEANPPFYWIEVREK